MDRISDRDTAIALVEPQSQGIPHAPFNAALLHTAALAYPHLRIRFHAQTIHAQEVKDILSQLAPQVLPQVDWYALPRPPGSSIAARWISQRSLLGQVLARERRVLFCSISRMQLLQLKGRMRVKNCGAVRAVLHGELDQLEHAAHSPLRPFSLNGLLVRPNRGDLRYLLLGRSIRDNIPPRYEAAFHHAGVLDHPYHFAPPQPMTQCAPVFGIFGNCGDGRIIESVVRAVRSSGSQVRFRLIGYLSGAEAVERLRPFVEDVAAAPVPRRIFVERAHSVTHALWLAPADAFRLRASGTFYDALCYAKPLIYTANAFIDSYFALQPEIGTRCSSVAEVAEAVLQVAEQHNAQRYAHSQAAILRLRERFTPQAQAGLLVRALDWD